MTSVTTLPFGRPLTRADLEELPEDGHRYELIDGSLIVSPASTRRVDLLLKRDRLQAAHVPSYWLVDPEEPSITILELVHGRYEQVAVVSPEDEYDVARPFPLRLAPARLRYEP